MKYLNLAILTILILVRCGSPATSPEGLDLKKYDLSDVPGSTLKKAVLQNDNGKLLEEGFVQDGKKQGTWVIYHHDRETPKTIANYVNGVLNGPYFDFQPYGQVELMCNYSNGKLHGHFSKYKSIRKTEEGDYVDGELDGIYKKYYDGKAIVQQELTYKGGELDGQNVYYNDKGEITMKYTYRDGEKVEGGIVSKASAQ